MNVRFAELDRQETPMGLLTVRRRLEPVLQVDVFEVKLGDEHLMSSVFTAAEIALADLALAALGDEGPSELDVLVGGLGLGYTATAALADPRVRRLDVVEALFPVIDWHERRLFPESAVLVEDPRTELLHGDFFGRMSGDGQLGRDGIDRHHVILLDIDHTPSHVLHPSHASFYTRAGLRRVLDRLHPAGVFALWSDGPDDGFQEVADAVFGVCEAHEVRFPNHHTGGEASNTVYVARAPDRGT